VSDALVIRDLSESIVDGWNEVSAEVDGERVFYRSPTRYSLARRVEPFVGIALLEAMARNVDIRIDSTVSISARLHNALPQLQAIFKCWNSRLHNVNVHAPMDSLEPAYERVASFYSAGVDSSHTLCRNIGDITHLVMLSGFDEGNDDEGNDRSSWLQGIQRQDTFARSIGKELIPVESNARQWTRQRKIIWEFAHGLILSSMGPLLRAKRLYVAASHTYSELFPWGSHPLTDPLWSTESTEVIHDGAGFRRGEKMRDLCGNQVIVDNLKVCWRSSHENCGICPKCVRTMTALYLLNGTSRALPPLRDLSLLKHFRATDESGATFLEDAMILAKESGNRTALKTLRRKYRRYQMSKVIPMLDRYALGGVLRRLYRRVMKPKWLTWRAIPRGPQPWEQ